VRLWGPKWNSIGRELGRTPSQCFNNYHSRFGNKKLNIFQFQAFSEAAENNYSNAFIPASLQFTNNQLTQLPTSDINESERNRSLKSNFILNAKDNETLLDSTTLFSNLQGINGIRRYWDDETDALLIELSEKYNKSWKRIGNFFVEIIITFCIIYHII
jgi:hypothetical protein